MCPVLTCLLLDLNPEFRICFSNSSVEPESAILHDASDLLSSVTLNNPSHGLFNDKYPLHVIPHPEKQNTFMNRISYDTQSNSYYENGIVDKKYLEFWDKGVLYYENLKYATEYSYDRTISRDTMALFPDYDDFSSSIIYKFDYSPYENLGISSLALKLNCFNENTNYNWVISISTNSDITTSNSIYPSNLDIDLKNRKWKKIKETNNYTDKNNYYERLNLENLTHYVRNKKFFYIKAEIFRDRFYYGKNIQLFPQTKRCSLENNIKENFTLDVIVELSPLTSNNLTKSLKINVESMDKLLKLKNQIEKGESSTSNENALIFGGLFNDKYRCNVLPSEEKKDIYTHRISYNAITNAYYENGINHIKYLKRWDRGTFKYSNIYYYPEFLSDIKIYRTLSHDKKNIPAYITWKFDYRPGNLYLSSLKLKLKFFNLSDREKIKWSIQLLPTRKNPDPKFKSIMFPLNEENFNNLDYTIDLTEMVKGEYGFILKAYLNGVETHQLFRQYVKEYPRSLLGYDDYNIDDDDDENFSMDIKMELRPNMLCDSIKEEKKIIKNNNAINENLLFNDKNTSDFIIKLELPREDYCEDITEKIFYLHTKVLSSGSDYFQALLNSHMLESQNRCLKLTDVSYFILEKLLLFIYTNNLENINELEDWIDLLYAASRFLLPKLIQVCELSIRKLVNFDNVENIEMAAYECCSMQLVKYCEMFEIKNNEKNENKIFKKEIIEIPKYVNKRDSVVKKFKSLIKNLTQRKREEMIL